MTEVVVTNWGVFDGEAYLGQGSVVVRGARIVAVRKPRRRRSRAHAWST